MHSPVVQVTTTTPTEDDAARIATALLDARLAACVQVDGPITSRYRWQGALEEAVEWRCTVKTTQARSDDAVAAIVAAHPYDVPEVLVSAVLDGHARYLEWVDAEVAS